MTLKSYSLEDKRYPDYQSKPLWAVEKTDFNISDFSPLWGMVHSGYETAKELWTLRAENFWLPAVGSLSVLSSIDSLASTTVFASAISAVYEILQQGLLITSWQTIPGLSNIPLSRLWRDMSSSPATASDIINLIYTDIISTAVVGTKSAVRASLTGAGPETPNALAQFSEFTRQIQFDWRYRVPAILILAAAVFALLFVLLMWIISRVSISYLRQLLNQTSTGRLVTNILYPKLTESTASTKKWTEKAGSKRLAFSMQLKQEAVDTANATKTRPSQPSKLSVTFDRAEGKKTPLYRVLHKGQLHSS